MSHKLSQELYQSMVLDHNRTPHHFGIPPLVTHSQKGVNASCGDKLELYVHLEGDTLQDLGFVGEGCAIFKSCCSILSDEVIGKSLKEVRETLTLFEEMILKKEELTPENTQKLGKLSIFWGIKQYPARVKCALLGPRTLEAIVNFQSSNLPGEISTEE